MVTGRVPRRRGLSTFALAFTIGAAAARAVSAPAPAPPTGLTPGKAKGTLTVDGKPVTLGYAYAALEPNPFDKARDDIVILLSEQPVPPDALKGKLSRAGGAAGLASYLLVAFREDRAGPSPFSFLGPWVVGNRRVAHASLKEIQLQMSPDYDMKVDAVAVGKDRVEATVYTKRPQSSFEHQFEYRVAFNAAVRPRIP